MLGSKAIIFKMAAPIRFDGRVALVTGAGNGMLKIILSANVVMIRGEVFKLFRLSYQ